MVFQFSSLVSLAVNSEYSQTLSEHLILENLYLSSCCLRNQLVAVKALPRLEAVSFQVLDLLVSWSVRARHVRRDICLHTCKSLSP